VKSAASLFFLILLLSLSGTGKLFAQYSETEKDQLSDTLSRKKLTLAVAAAGTVYAGSMIGLYTLWYRDYPQSAFHFINDNGEWLQMDKFGHTTTSYYIGMVGYSALRWSGVPEQKCIWYGGMSGLVYLTTVEVMDGFSEQWGASAGDLAANTLGTALFIGQQLAWHEQKFVLKWSFHGSPYAAYNPEQLGKTGPERMLKDYNGQTYWVSANLSSLGLRQKGFPKWLNLAAGYGAEGMTGPSSNPAEINGVPVPPGERYRQFYLSPDIDLTRIPVKSKTLKLILNTFGFIKIPMPAVEFSGKGVRILPLYF
jgi:hypothetical protein